MSSEYFKKIQVQTLKKEHKAILQRQHEHWAYDLSQEDEEIISQYQDYLATTED